MNDALGMPPLMMPRSAEWGPVEREHKAAHPACANCGSLENVVVHHKKPFHLFPELELAKTNLISLCEHPSHNCHLIQGHLLCWRSYNEHVDADCATYLKKVEGRPMIRHPLLKLGKKAARHDDRTIPLRAVLHNHVPLPKTYSYHKLHKGCAMGMFGNDQFGCCVKAAQANQTEMFEFNEQGHSLDISTQDVLNEYFDETGGEDTGLVVLDSLKRWRKLGWMAAGKRYFVQGFTSIALRESQELMQVIYADVGAPIGLSLPDGAEEQFARGERWTVGPDNRPNPENGHCVLAEGWDEKGPLFVTWNRVQRATWEFYYACCDEAYAVIDARDNFKAQQIINTVELRRRIAKAAA